MNSPLHGVSWPSGALPLAVSDFQYAYNLKPSKSSYLISRWQGNLAPVTTCARPMN